CWQEVSILRGLDGFGFAIFSDHPVRVQAVDPGGPAQRSGLRQGDLVLQLNGLPVESWTCADLAQAIRSCPSRIILAVWRGLPELGSVCETWLHPQLYNPNPPGNHGNYQNCTVFQSHLLWPGYGDTSLPPKTVIFPFFVQPLDFCSPVRTLRMSEEMILHQAHLLPSKVSVLIFSDLLLLARQEEGGHCTVLRSPLYLNALRLREVPWEPLRLHLLQRSAGGWRCVFSLEAFNAEQKVRVGLCLRDDRRRCLVAMETTLPWQQQGESSSEVLDSGGSGLRPPTSQEEEEEEERGCRPPVLRRSLSEGSLLQEARLPLFLSDSTIRQLRPTLTFDPSLPPPHCLPQLTKEGASLHPCCCCSMEPRKENPATSG
ncbi:regulator of G-protein signaling 3-like, partial [Poeciliopsis prolifica]|uniref:regulator of G-protein signaling 3-like n=1 Tax=Poeciliopsis prolifica TaxID=188132 RepID=UPI002413907B